MFLGYSCAMHLETYLIWSRAPSTIEPTWLSHGRQHMNWLKLCAFNATVYCGQPIPLFVRGFCVTTRTRLHVVIGGKFCFAWTCVVLPQPVEYPERFIAVLHNAGWSPTSLWRERYISEKEDWMKSVMFSILSRDDYALSYCTSWLTKT